MVEFAFIILHYQSLEDTLRCIESIQKMENGERIGIVLIDNASPNGSGKLLYDRFAHEPQIKVILNQSNDGFSHANNIGCDFAAKEWNPKYFVVANNDIVFEQVDFVRRVEEIYQRKPFFILGPDIFNVRTGKHQSPMGLDTPTLQRSLKTIRLNAICLKLYALTYPLMRIWYKRLATSAVDAENFDVEQNDVYVQGACVIFSEDYYKARGRIYEPETYFFAEEAIFTRWCERNGKTVIYSPEIKVLHNESASTLSEKDMRKRIRFQMSNILEATKIYAECLQNEK